MATIEERVKQIVVNQLGVDPGEVVSVANFVENLGADELDLTELFMETDSIFFKQTQMSDEILDFLIEEVKTVGELVNWIIATIEKKAKEIVVNQLGVDPGEAVSVANFVENLGADELDLTELFKETDSVFFKQTQMSDETLDFLIEEVKTVGELINWVKENI